MYSRFAAQFRPSPATAERRRGPKIADRVGLASEAALHGLLLTLRLRVYFGSHFQP
jgi:hypothetical protein